MDDVSSLFGILGVGVLVELFVPIVLGAVFVVVVVASRSEPDPTGLRPSVVYMLTTCFISFFVAMVASVVTVAALSSLIGRRVSSTGTPHAVGNEVARIAVVSLLVTAAALIAFSFHGRKARLAGRHEIAVLGQPATVLRIWQTYTAAVSFTCVMLMIGSGIVAVYQLFRLMGPGVFSPSSPHPVAAFRVLLPSLYLLIAATLVRLAHQRLVLIRPAPQPPMPPPDGGFSDGGPGDGSPRLGGGDGSPDPGDDGFAPGGTPSPSGGPVLEPPANPYTL